MEMIIIIFGFPILLMGFAYSAWMVLDANNIFDKGEKDKVIEKQGEENKL